LTRITIATRESQLALWQAHEVSRLLTLHHPELDIEILGMTTQGDRFLQASLAKAGGKGLFVKELEQCLIDERADIAVHSMKDVPFELPSGLHISTILEREDPRDAFVSNDYSSLEALPENAVVGTSSTRRECQIRALRPDCNIRPLRGNVNTRLAKLDEGQYDAIILASAGLKRLGFADRISHTLDTNICLPAIGQGAIGIECRQQDANTQALLQPLHHEITALSVYAERKISTALSANCHLPIAAHATQFDQTLTLRALVGSLDGQQMLRAELTGELSAMPTISQTVADDLIAQGALELMASMNDSHS
jgi:hydroxymethylbilane synthase